LYFEKSGTPKSPPMEGGCEILFWSGRKKGYLYRDNTGGCLSQPLV